MGTLYSRNDGVRYWHSANAHSSVNVTLRAQFGETAHRLRHAPPGLFLEGNFQKGTAGVATGLLREIFNCLEVSWFHFHTI